MKSVDEALAALYPGQIPRRWDRPAGADPDADRLESVTAHRHPAGHWHYVTRGLTELHEKTWVDPNLSGWGFEMTLRLADPDPGTAEAPEWPVAILRYLAVYVYDARRVFVPGDHIPARSLLADGLPGFAAFLCMEDPGLRGIDTPNGRVEFVQLVAVREDEMMAVRNGRLLEMMTRIDESVPWRLSGDRPTALTGQPPRMEW